MLTTIMKLKDEIIGKYIDFFAMASKVFAALHDVIDRDVTNIDKSYFTLTTIYNKNKFTTKHLFIYFLQHFCNKGIASILQ